MMFTGEGVLKGRPTCKGGKRSSEYSTTASVARMHAPNTIVPNCLLLTQGIQHNVVEAQSLGTPQAYHPWYALTTCLCARTICTYPTISLVLI